MKYISKKGFAKSCLGGSAISKVTNFLSSIGEFTDSSRLSYSFTDSANHDQNSLQNEIEVVEVTKIYQLKDFKEITGRVKNLKRRRAKLNAIITKYKHMNQPQKAKIYVNKKAALKPKLEMAVAKLKNINDIYSASEMATGKAIASFKTKLQRDRFLDKFHSNFLNTYVIPSTGFMYYDSKMRVFEAPEPSDILWSNLGQGFWSVIVTRLLTYLGSLVILLLAFILITAIKIAQKEILETHASQFNDISGQIPVVVTLISLGTSLVISAVNILIKIIMRYFVRLEMHYSRTDFDDSLSKKLIRVQFINTCLILSILHLRYSKELW